MSKQTDQTEPVDSLDIIDCLSENIFFQDDILNDDLCREETQKEPELKETDCCIQQVNCSQAQTEESSVAPLQKNSQMSFAQPEATSIASFQLPTQSSSSSPPFQSSLAQKDQTETISAIDPMQIADAHKEQMKFQDPKPKEHADLCLPKPPDKVEFVLPEFSTKLQLPMEKYELEFKVLPNHLKNANIRARGTPHLKEEKLIMLLHEYMKEIRWVMTKSKGVLHYSLNSVGTLFPPPIT